jgi:anti-sigma regulatory factor (Ser/Thr protein kinase)
MSLDPLTSPGTLESLGKIREYTRQAIALAGLDRKRAYRLLLAVDEIASNIVIHGYEEAGLQGEIVTRASLTDDALVISLEDTAIPYNPLEQPTPSGLELPLEERPFGGLGVYLAIQNIDRYDYFYENGRNRNILVMKKEGQDG